jgi:hypothetical protein
MRMSDDVGERALHPAEVQTPVTSNKTDTATEMPS